MKRGWSPGELVKKYGYKPNDKKISFKVTLYEQQQQQKKQKRDKEQHFCVDTLYTQKQFGWNWKNDVRVDNSSIIIRYIRQETDGNKIWTLSDIQDPFVYIWYTKDGWFLFRQVAKAFFMKKNLFSYFDQIKKRSRIKTIEAYKHIDIRSIRATPRHEMYKKIRMCGVSGHLCHCCSDDKSAYCGNIDIVSLQSVRILMRMESIPCNRALPLLEAIVELTKGNKKKRALTSSDKQKILISQRCKCAQCEEFIDHEEGYEVDHIFRISRGGSNNAHNLVVLCTSCHKKKTEEERSIPFVPI